MPSITVDDLEWDDDNERECRDHGFSPEIALEVLMGPVRFFPNKPRRTGTHMMIGPDSTQRCWTIPIVPTSTQGRWRPITGIQPQTRKWSFTKTNCDVRRAGGESYVEKEESEKDRKRTRNALPRASWGCFHLEHASCAGRGCKGTRSCIFSPVFPPRD